MPKLFLSYSACEKPYAKQLIHSLKSFSAEIFADRDEIQSGENWSAQIRQSIQSADAIVVLLSTASIESKWVMMELGIAWGLGIRVIPVIPPDVSFSKNDLPPVLQDIHIIKVGTQKIESVAKKILARVGEQ